MEAISVIIFCVIVFSIWYCCGGGSSSSSSSSSSSASSSKNKLYPDLSQMKKSNSKGLFSFFGGNSYSSFVDRFTSLEDVTSAIRQAGVESCGLIFGKFSIHYCFYKHGFCKFIWELIDIFISSQIYPFSFKICFC